MTDLIKIVHKRWISLPIRVRGTVILAIPATCLFTALSAFACLKVNLTEDEAWVQHTQTVRLETKRLLNTLLDAETGVIGYGLTGQDEFLEPYKQAQTVIPISLKRLEQLVRDDPHQTHKIHSIHILVDENLEFFYQKTILQQELKRIRGRADVLVPAASIYDWLEEGTAKMNATRQEIDRFAQREEELLAKRIRHRDYYRQMTWVILCVLGAIGTIATIFSIHLFYQLERELANREENLRDSNQRLENVCDQLQRFTANASHELRAPLAAVLSNAQVGLMDLDDLEEIPTSVQKRLKKIVGITKHMSSLVGELLFLARHEGLLADESMKTVDLTQLVSSLFSEWFPQAKNQSLQLTKKLPDREFFVQADASLLRQAIANLLSNACRYTPAGGSIELGLKVAEKWALIWVSDTGIGISAEALPHVFERFYRADLKRSKASGGFGLGLAIADQIVRAHGGEIGAESTPGKGSKFIIKLPILN